MFSVGSRPDRLLKITPDISMSRHWLLVAAHHRKRSGVYGQVQPKGMYSLL